jgi:hypothetical protein
MARNLPRGGAAALRYCLRPVFNRSTKRVPEPKLSESVRRFVAEHIDSAESLEILLYLHRNRDQSHTAETLGPAVYTVPAAALLRLEALTRAGFAASDGAADPAYRYAPATPLLGQQVDALAAAYSTDRVGVIQTIFERPRSAAQSLADAFRLRRND